ncbi:response regulator [Photobacterium minamisatsumaniensis]|uniref:response regulator n=1 Tax=Photobacterium minamisatsumaniensis TaxID=2910233 RepID=UPI003D1482E3
MYMLKEKSVLVVDDSPIIQQTTKAVLQKCGFQGTNLYSVSNAVDALQACRSMAFDILLLDFNLGNGRSGLQLLEQLHHLDLLTHNPLVLIITADDSLPIVMAFAEFEPDDYLVKPLRPNNLQKRLVANLSQQQLNESIWQAFNLTGVTGARKALQQAQNEKSFKLAITQLCKRLAKHQQLPTAIALLKSFITQHDYLPAKLLLIELLLRSNSLEQATQNTAEVQTAFPQHIKVLDLSARIYLKNNDLQQGYLLWLKAHQLSHYNLERLLGLILIENTLLSKRGYSEKLLKDANRLLQGSIWDSRDMRCLLSWGLLQNTQKSVSSIERLWCSISREDQTMAAERPYLQILQAWQSAQQDRKLLAFKQVQQISVNSETKNSYVFQLLSYRLYQLLNMRSAMQKCISQIALLCTLDKCDSHKVIKYQWLAKNKSILTPDENYHQALTLYQRSPALAAKAVFAAWENNRFDDELAQSLIHVYCNDQIEHTPTTRESFIQARWVFESQSTPPKWYSALQACNSILQTPVEVMTRKAAGAIEA